MKEVFESMLGVFFIAALMLVSTSVISTSIDARNADATMQAYVTEIEHSNFSGNVLKAVFDQSGTDGYRNVKMTFYEKDDTGATSERNVTSKTQVGTTHRVYMVKLSMDYTYSMDFINKQADHTMTAYAR